MALPSLRQTVRRARMRAAARIRAMRSGRSRGASARRDRRIPWFGRSRAGVPRKKQSFRLVRDVLGAIAIVILVLGTAFVASGGAWPPVIVVESGSMMHPESETSYGRTGTIDVGDILFVRTMKDPEHDVRTWADGGTLHYGRPGDVIVYQPFGLGNATPIIHRAIAFVEIQRLKNISTTYVVHWTDHQQLRFNDSGIYMPELGFSEENGYSRLDGYKPQYAGFITKGDNPSTNAYADQAAGISDLVAPEWVLGTAHGEVPWVGLARLATQTGQTNPTSPGWLRVGNGYAPLELWTMFFVTLGSLILIPLAWDTVKVVRENRQRQRQLKRLLAEQRTLDDRVVAFEAIPE